MRGVARFLAYTTTLALFAGFLFASGSEAHARKATRAKPSVTASLSTFKEACAAVDAFHAALARGNTKAALKLLADDVKIFEQGEVERSRTEYAEHHLPADIAFSRATRSALIARTGSAVGDIAYVMSEGTITGRYKDKEVNAVTIETIVLRRSQKGWRIAHIHWSSRKVKPHGGQ